ncbi:MAG: nucleotide pyrophosphohydrolase [Desulfobulbaceae bacterium]|uniref:Nucleotide pyrophosphohydrolase n=1 Tax=Candidatus Desulfatifera sulfidica TaxID=2841691 RepID=A0A8J6NCD0_9BACT|nr:nucleotide pyrophosphohydrolase [Candidatus Desulfatifera sulfidica]
MNPHTPQPDTAQPPVETLFHELHKTIKTLRGPKGCPWDIKQTNDSLKKYLQEEMTETISAMDDSNYDNLCEELGDLLFLILLATEVNKENGHFGLADVITQITSKMIRRHPHVFGNISCDDETLLNKQWEAIKSQEKRGKTV